MASKEAYLAELDRARGCNLEYSNLAALKITLKTVSSPWRSPQQGQGKNTLNLHWLEQRQQERTFQIRGTDIV